MPTAVGAAYRRQTGREALTKEDQMYVVVLHEIKDQEAAFARGERLQTGDGAPEGVRVLQFYPAVDGSRVTCLWEAPSVVAVQQHADEVLGSSSVNTCYEVAAEPAFAERALGLASAPMALR
jgi:hypothetical protein